LIRSQGVVELNLRTKTRVQSHPGAYAFKVGLGDCTVPVVDCRRTWPHIAAAEIAWYLSGSRDITWLQSYAGIWNKFVEDDGVTIKNAYGYRWRKHFNRDQIALAVKALQYNPSDRQVVISAWDPSRDGLKNHAINNPQDKNVPCPAMFTFSIVDGYIHSSVFIRSSDVFVGLPYDVYGHVILTHLMRNWINSHTGVDERPLLKPGSVHFTLAHPHIYEPHWKMADEALDQPYVDLRHPLPPCPELSEFTEPSDDSLVDDWVDYFRMNRWIEYNPAPEVIV
jgi:thymidylate synthase